MIYNVTDEMKKAMTGLLEPTFKEVRIGVAEVRNTFKVPKFGTIAGCMVTEGRITRAGDTQARLLRDNVVVYEGKIGSLRRFKDDASEVKTGFECGIGFERFNDIKVGDLIEVFTMERVAVSRRRIRRIAVGMSQGSRPDRVADQIRSELAMLLAREVHDPGIGFVTLTRVQVSPDLQLARVMYTVLGDEKAATRAHGARARGAVPPPADRRAAAPEADARAEVRLRRFGRRPGPHRAASSTSCTPHAACPRPRRQ